MTTLFDKAKAKPVAKGKAAKPEEALVKTPGLELYAYVDALEKQLAALKKTMKPDLDSAMIDQFLANKGENYKGTEGTATASLELRKRASNSALTEIEVALLQSKKISTLEIDGDYKINPEHVLNSRLMKKVSDALEKVPGLPADFIQFDASKARTVTTETSIEEVFKLNDRETQRELLKVVGVTAIKPKTSAKIETVLEEVEALLCPKED